MAKVEEEYTVFIPNVIAYPGPKSAYMTVFRMNFTMLVLLAVLFAAAPHALARPGSHEVREAVRDAQQYQKNGKESDRYGRYSDSNSSGAAADTDASKKPGRMSPEERRALRQQINEAGQDLYSRRR